MRQCVNKQGDETRNDGPCPVVAAQQYTRRMIGYGRMLLKSLNHCLFLSFTASFFGGCSLFRWGGLERRGEKKKEEKKKKKLGIAGDVARQLSDCGFISARDSTLTEDHPLSPPSLCRLLFFRCHKTSAKIQSRTVVVKKEKRVCSRAICYLTLALEFRTIIMRRRTERQKKYEDFFLRSPAHLFGHQRKPGRIKKNK